MTMPFRLEPILEEKRLNAYKLAKMLDGKMPQATVYRLVSGEKSKLSPEEVDLLCETLGISPNQLFGYRRG